MAYQAGELLGPRTKDITNLVPRPRSERVHYLYKTWDNIKQRVTNQNHKDYPRYGGRGIGMYAMWFESYDMFSAYVLSTLGERPEGYSLDRIDNDRGYEPGNLRWATPKEQSNNRSIEVEQRPTHKTTQQETDNIAAYLVDKFRSPEFKPLFLKVAWRLDRGTIDRHVAAAFELGKNPRAYFIALVKREKAYYE